MHPIKFLTPLLGKASQCASVIYRYLDDKNSDEVTMMRAWVNLLIAAILFSLLFGVMSHAGTVVVRQSSTPFDAFAVRDQLLQQHQWQELLRQQQQVTILQSLPIGCLAIASPFNYFSCGQQFYRPYDYQDTQVFIQIDPPLNEIPAQ